MIPDWRVYEDRFVRVNKGGYLINVIGLFTSHRRYYLFP